MDDHQFAELIEALQGMATSISDSQVYTLTGAADWGILQWCLAGMFLLLGVIWADLKFTIKDQHKNIRAEIKTEIVDRKEGDNEIWAELRRCKEDCHDTPKPRKEPR